jgi:hypothetical protein
MKKSLLVLISICNLFLLEGCGSSTQSSPPFHAVATHFSVTPATATPVAGTAFNFTVTALDASNSLVSTYAGTVHFSSSDAQAMLPADSTLTNGAKTLSATLKTSGSQTITATDTTTPSIASSPSPTTVSPAATSQLSVTAPASANAGTAFIFTVTAQDQFSNAVTTYSGTVHFSSSDPKATLPTNATLTSGTGTFSVTLKTPLAQTISATDTLTPSITGTSKSVNVSAPLAAAHFSVTVPATASAGTPFNFSVSALDASYKLLTSYSGTVQFTSSDPQAVFSVNNTTLTNGTGTFLATLHTLGRQTIKATDTTTASITGTSISVTVLGPPATHFSVSVPANATVGTAFDVTVTALDSNSKTTNNYSGTVHFTSTDPQADLPVDSLLTNGSESFSAGLKTLGGQKISATDTVTSSITGTSNSISASAAAAANPVPLIYQPLNPAAILPGGGLAFKLTVDGTGFVSGSTVKWNGGARATTFVSNSKLTAAILASDVAKFSTASVTVFNPTPGGGTSNAIFFEITRPTSSVALSATSAFPAGSGPDSAAVGDFNGDGKLDLAVANASSNNISIFLGNGDGSFQAAVNYAVGSFPSSVVVGDFNGDGKLDLATANSADNNVSVLLGNGDGTFQTALTTPFVGTNPGSLAVGDVNNDGKLDLVVGSSGATPGVNGVNILLGNGDGSFQPALQNDAGFGVDYSVAVADFNHDGKLDLAVVNVGTGVSVLLGNGDGTFQPPVSYAAGPVPISLAVGDFDGDGKLDLSVSNIPSGNTGPNVVSVLLGNGDGTFKPHVDYSVGSYATYTSFSSVTLGDFNGDGQLDLAVANQGSSNSASILLGNGDGTFQSAVNYPGGTSVMAAGDFNGDGRLDLAILGAQGVSLLLQPGLVYGSDAILLPTSLTFAAQLLATTSSAQIVQLTNYGTATLNISGIALSTNYSETNTCGSTLAAGASCFISVTFTPGALGTLTGTLTITDDAPGSPQTVSLSGLGTEVALSPASLRFSCVTMPGPNGPVYVCSGPQQVTVTNIGPTALAISAITITGPFSQTNTCVASLAMGQSCSITVTWASPHNVGSGVLSITDNGGASPQTVPLSAFVQRR